MNRFLRKIAVCVCSIGLVGVLFAIREEEARKITAAAKPNIVVILADDLGWMDINPTAEYATGTPAKKQYYETPNLNKLARDGVSFSRCYSMPLCTPSRATLLTGRNGATFGFNNAASMRAKNTFAQKNVKPTGEYLPYDSIPGINPRFPLITAVGNYAIPNGLPDSKGQKMYALPEMLPDYSSAFLGKWHIGGDNVKGHRPQDFGFEPIAYEDEGWSSYKKNCRKNWHFPGPASQEDYLTDDLTALSVNWIRDHVNKNRQKPFLLYLSHFGVHDPYQAKKKDVEYFKKKSTRGWNGHDNPTYAGMIRALDDSVGTISEALRKLGVADNTIIVFVSDNGGQCKKHDINVTSNSPMRGQKAQTFEGGIRVPMIIYMPKNKNKGKWVHTPVTLSDIAPTLTSLTRQKVPKQIANKLSGKSLVPLLANRKDKFTDRAIFVHEPYYRPSGNTMISPSSVIIEGDYKLIAYHDGVMRLYHIPSDIGEKKDLSKSMPKRVSNMKTILAKWRFANIPDRYDTSKNLKYKPGSKNALPKPQGKLFVRSTKLEK